MNCENLGCHMFGLCVIQPFEASGERCKTPAGVMILSRAMFRVLVDAEQASPETEQCRRPVLVPEFKDK